MISENYIISCVFTVPPKQNICKLCKWHRNVFFIFSSEKSKARGEERSWSEGSAGFLNIWKEPIKWNYENKLVWVLRTDCPSCFFTIKVCSCWKDSSSCFEFKMHPFSVLLFDVQRQRGRHQTVAATAARHHGSAAAAVAMETASSSTTTAAATAADGRSGRGRGGGRLLQLLLVDFPLLRSSVLEPDLHLEQMDSCQNFIWSNTRRSDINCSFKSRINLNLIQFNCLFQITNSKTKGMFCPRTWMDVRLPVSQTDWASWRAPPSSWWWCICCSGTPSPAPGAGDRCKPPGTCLWFAFFHLQTPKYSD